MAQLCQNLGEDLMKWKGLNPQVLLRQREGIYRQCSGIWNLRHKGGSLEIHMERTPKVEQVPHDLFVEQPLRREGLVLAGKQVSYDIYLPWNMECPQRDAQIDDQLKYEFQFLSKGQRACPPSLFM